MSRSFDCPPSFFKESGSRQLRLDNTLRSLFAGSKAHGPRPARHSALSFAQLGANLVLRGRGSYVEADGRTHELTPGTLFQRLPGIEHSTYFDPDSDYAELFVVIDSATANQLLKIGLLCTSPVLQIGIDPLIIDAFRHLIKRIKLSESQLSSSRVLLESISFLHDLYDRARTRRVMDPWEKAMEDACMLLEHNLDERAPLQAIAHHVGVSYAAFRKHFKQATGYSPADYRIRRRLESAQHILMGNSVMATARELGYGDAYAFSTQFKAFVGVSPREFQRHMKHTLMLVQLTRRA